MIERFYLKEYLSFQEVELNLKNGLIVFSGASGSGKSILMEAILTSLGASSCDAKVCESSVTWELDTQHYGIENEEPNVLRHTKKEKSRYFINNQSVSKKTLYEIVSHHLKHLSLRDFSDFKNENLLDIIDTHIIKQNPNFATLKQNYTHTFRTYKEKKQQLQQIEDEEKRVIELKEFATFEIEKIASIDPFVGEDEKLLEIKKALSKKEKVLQKIQEAYAIFEYEHTVGQTLQLLEHSSDFFDDMMNELRVVFDTAVEEFNSLEEEDIEDVLNRLEALSGLKRRYGSIQEALEYKEQKIEELKKYENIEYEKGSLQKECQELNTQLHDLAHQLSLSRKEALPSIQTKLNNYLKQLYLEDATLTITQQECALLGEDHIDININNTQLTKISTGEFNRLRLGILALKSENLHTNHGVLMLDEIDANLSGEESMSVAKVLKKLSKTFQIFVISHQPQLTSMGDQHFLVYKDGTISKTKELTRKQRVDEIARIISGSNISHEAKQFAQELLGE